MARSYNVIDADGHVLFLPTETAPAVVFAAGRKAALWPLIPLADGRIISGDTDGKVWIWNLGGGQPPKTGTRRASVRV